MGAALDREKRDFGKRRWSSMDHYKPKKKIIIIIHTMKTILSAKLTLVTIINIIKEKVF
jgi:hypothetical protein